MRDVLRTLLTGAGYAVLLAATGREALALAENLDASVAIVDLAMPDGDGVQTCVALRTLPRWRDVPIVVLTHYHTTKALQATRRAGASGFVAKPFVPADLLRYIENSTARRVASIQGALATGGDGQRANALPDPAASIGSRTVDSQMSAASLDQQQAILRVYRSQVRRETDSRDPLVVTSDGRPRVLLAEPDAPTRDHLRQTLQTEGYAVDVATDGRETLAMVIRNQYDLILMNVRMPVMGGIEVAHAIRGLPRPGPRRPIVAMTESAAHLLAQDLKDAGMDDCLMKPVAPHALLACARRHLMEKTADATAAQARTRNQAPDLDTLAKVAGLFAPGAMLRFLSNLVTSVEEILTRMDGGWMVEGPIELRRRLHSLAGTAGTLGCDALSVAARELENDRSGSEQLQQEFIETARATLRAIRAFTATGSPRPRG
jgi:CheY-like chemotaxis protein